METSDEMNLGNELIPEQLRGSEMNASAEVQFDNLTEAEAFYRVARQRLLEVNQWYKFAEAPLSVFKLFDHAGRSVQRPAEDGDYIRIDIPGPGTKAGKGYDWVIIEKLTEDIDEQGHVVNMRVRPSAHPLGNDEQTAHFLKDSSTNTLQVKQIGLIVRAEQHGRNEEPNTDTDSLLDNLRNTMVGWSSKIGFSYPQWKSLVKGLCYLPQI